MLKDEIAVVADTETFFRAGISDYLKKLYRQVVAVESLGDLETILAGLSVEPRVEGPVNLLILDAGLAETTDYLTSLRKDYPQMRVMITSSSNKPSIILDCLRAGAHGYIPRHSPIEVIFSAIKMVGSGNVYVPPCVTNVATEPQVADPTPTCDDPRNGLSRRESQVLEHLSEGLSNKEIARKMCIAPGTVKVHLNSCFRKLGVHNRISAMKALPTASTASQIEEINHITIAA